MNQALLNPVSRTFLLLTLLLLFSTSPAENISPDIIEGSTTIDAETLIQLANELNQLIIIDARIRTDRRQGFIPDSISLPDTDTDCNSLFRVIDRKNTPTVFYCNGPKCRRSEHAVKIAIECGYTNIYWFRGGFEEWLKKQYLIHKY
jgi:rhodanese-related sulfurtransferase